MSSPVASASASTRAWRQPCRSRRIALIGVCLLLALGVPGMLAPTACARVVATTAAPSAPAAPSNGNSLEAAANRAGDTGRKVAMSLIGLAFAVAAIVLSFRRDFKEAAGVLAIGMVAVLLATPAGIRLLQDTVSSIFGSQ